MAFTRLGSISDIHSIANIDSVGRSVTVPVGTTLAVMVVSGYTTASSPMDSGTATLAGLSMTLGANADIGGHLAAVWYLANASISSGTQMLTWNWGDTENFSNGGHLILAYYSGVDTASPVRDSDVYAGQVGTSTSNGTTPTITASSDDLLIAGCYILDTNNPTSNAWSLSAGTISSLHDAVQNGSWGGMAEGWPSGNTTVTVNPDGNSGDDLWMAIGAVVFKPAAGGKPWYYYSQL